MKRKKVFPKPVQRLNSITALELGKNSNKLSEYYHRALYNKDDIGTIPAIGIMSERQTKQLDALLKRSKNGV